MQKQMIDLANFNIYNLPYVDYDVLRKIPKNISGVYFVVDLSEIYYIGQSINIRERLLKHSKRSIFKWLSQREYHDTLSVAWLEVGNISLLDSLEQVLINHFKPQLNIRGMLHEHNNSCGNLRNHLVLNLCPL